MVIIVFRIQWYISIFLYFSHNNVRFLLQNSKWLYYIPVGSFSILLWLSIAVSCFSFTNSRLMQLIMNFIHLYYFLSRILNHLFSHMPTDRNFLLLNGIWKLTMYSSPAISHVICFNHQLLHSKTHQNLVAKNNFIISHDSICWPRSAG